MLCELLRLLGTAALLQVRGRSDEHVMRLAKCAHHQAILTCWFAPHTHSYVKSLVDDVNTPIGRVQYYADAGIAPHELRQEARQAVLYKVDGAAGFDRSARLGTRKFNSLDRGVSFGKHGQRMTAHL